MADLFEHLARAFNEQAVSSADKKDTRGESIEDNDEEFYDEDE